MTALDEYNFEMYLKGLTENAEKRGRAAEKNKAESKIKAVLEKHGLPESEINQIIKSYRMM